MIRKGRAFRDGWNAGLSEIGGLGVARALSLDPAMDHENRIDGRPRPSVRTGRFTWRAASAPCEELGTFPRSGTDEVREARRVLAGGVRDWWRRPLEERRRLVERGLARFAGALQRHGIRLADGLGLDPDEYEPELDRARKDGSLAARKARPAPGGVTLILADWRVRAGALAAAVARSLVEGRTLLLCSDERAPLLPELLVDSLLEAGLPSDAVALLHAPDGEAVGSAVKSGLEHVIAWGGRETIAGLRRLASGASVPTMSLHLHRALSDRLPRGVHPEDAAREVTRRAFGRAHTLSCARGGQLATLYVPAGELSEFTAALLQHLEHSRDFNEPLPALDPGAAGRAREAWTLGLDEGATLLAGGEQRGSNTPRLLLPVLMTNGEARMRAARRVEPTALLLLCRERD